MRLLIPLVGKSIVISTFLRDYYRQKGVQTLLVPPTVDTRAEKWRVVDDQAEGAASDASTLKLIYAGNPGRKDLIDRIIGALEYCSNAHLTIVGPDTSTLKAVLGDKSSLLERFASRLHLPGFVSSETIPRLLSQADFSIVLREDARYSYAGFPTKLVESMSAGTPMITTTFGDEGLYIRDGFNGFQVKSNGPAELKKAITNAAQTSKIERVQMAANALETAAKHFDYSAYVEGLDTFMMR